MKIIQVLNHFLPKNVAGTEIYVWALSKQLQKLGCQVIVVIPNYGSNDIDKYDYDGIPIYSYSEPSEASREIITGKKIPEGLIGFKSILRNESPDIVHFHEISGSNGIGINHFEIAKELGAKILFTLHLSSNTCRTGTLMYLGSTICDGKIKIDRCAFCALVQKTGSRTISSFIVNASKPFDYFGIDTVKWQNTIGTALSYPLQIKRLEENLQRIINVCDKIIPITNWYFNILLQNGVPADKMKVITQALSTSPEININKNKESLNLVRLIFVGRIDELKGISLLLNAVKAFPKNYLHLDIYGTALDKLYLESCKASSSSFENIRWMGKIKPGAAISTMKEYDALVLPSNFSEMSPFVIQEAFAAGIPVIGSNVYGIAEQIKDGVNGLLFDFGNVKSLRKVLNRIVSEPSLLEQLSIYKTIPRNFDEVANETMEVYQSLLKPKSFFAV